MFQKYLKMIQVNILASLGYTVYLGWGPRSQLDVLSQDPDYNAYNVQGDRGIDFSQY